jgi:hypothetical protein
MKSDSIGTGTSGVEVLNVSPHGFWLLVGEREYFLGFDHFPWFRQATLEQLFKAELLHESHLYWPDLDVDLDLDRIEHPESYPLIAQMEGTGEQETEQRR